MKPRIAIVGAGPIGIEAALHAVVNGYDAVVYERGRVGASLRDWGHVRLFSPWHMNVSALGLSILGSRSLPGPESLVTGDQMVESYLQPLSESTELRGRVHENVSVVHVGRDGLAKNDLIGSRRRRSHPFRLLLREGTAERITEADVVIDASGVWGNASYCGNGGIPAPGERQHPERVTYRIPDFTRPTTSRPYANARTLVVGGGHSAATTVCGLHELAKTHARTEVIWVTRRQNPVPFVPIPDDPLPFRAEVLREANRIAAEGRAVRHQPGTLIEAIDPGRQQPLVVRTRGPNGMSSIEVDQIIVNCGFRPDNSIYRELQIHECWATSGPMKLSAALLGETTADCLAQTSHGADTLVNPEHGFFIIGNKSYGRLPNFLMRIGRDQIGEVFSVIGAGSEVATGAS